MSFRNFMFLILAFFSSHCFGISWKQILDNYQAILPNDSILPKQHAAFALSQTPTIADPRIKSIPIFENNEELIDLRTIKHERIQLLPDPKVPFEAACYNSGLPNASKMRATVFTRLQMMAHAMDELAPFFGYERGQINIKLFEGLRDLSTQKMLFDNKLNEILTANPHMSIEMAEQETAKWVSPYLNNVPVHSTGAAVDISIWDNKNNVGLDLGILGAIWGKNDSAPTFSENISDIQKLNRLYCLMAAEIAGLINYSYEFWHFSCGDRYAAFWDKNDIKEKKAFYGPVQ